VAPVKVDVRIIAATHQDLHELVRRGAFREDLFHRLNVIRIHFPPLRERREDIGLADAPLPRQGGDGELGCEPKVLPPDDARSAWSAWTGPATSASWKTPRAG
jgi:two-component system nitrogen regulation response regulator GlnG